MDFGFDTVVDLLAMLDGSDMPTRIVYKNGPLRLEVQRGGQFAGPAAVATEPAAPQANPVAPSADSTNQEASVAQPPVESTAVESGTPVYAPIAGIFYRAPDPAAEPFVQLGQRVAADDVIGIVEVMKLMNTVRAGIAGTVVEICADNAQVVEFEQVLIRIDPEAAHND